MYKPPGDCWPTGRCVGRHRDAGVGVAAAGLRAVPDPAIGTIALIPGGGGDAAQQTAEVLATGSGLRSSAPTRPSPTWSWSGPSRGRPRAGLCRAAGHRRSEE